MTKPLIAALAAAVLTAAAAHAQAPQPAAPGGQPSGSASPGVGDLPVGRVLNEDQIRERLEKEGYRDVTEIKRQGPSYEAKAMRDGRQVQLTVDAATGSVRSTY